jgi:hypothetical protein
MHQIRTSEHNARIGLGVRAAAFRRRAQLAALKASHHRVIEALIKASAICQERAQAGDLLAQFLLSELKAAWVGLEAEDIAATDYRQTAATPGVRASN